MPEESAAIVLLAIVFVGYTAGTVLGFGTTILTVTFGALVIPMDTMLPIAAALNLALGGYIAIRYRREVRWRDLLVRILPPVAIGLPVGLLLFNLREVGWLRLVFGLLVVALGIVELASPRALKADAARPLSLRARLGWLLASGVVHGLYATAGPLIVYVVGREIPEKGAFRSTVSTLFLPLTVALLIDYVSLGLVTAPVAKLGAACTVPMLLGLLLGERLHERIDHTRFQRAVWAVLFIGGIILTVQSVRAVL